MNRKNVDITSTLSLITAPIVALIYLLIIGFGYSDIADATRLEPATALLTNDIIRLQNTYPLAATITTALMLVMGAMLNVMITARYTLFGSASQLPLALYAIFVAGLTTSSLTLSATFAAMVGVCALRDFFRTYEKSARTSKLFTACFWMGVLPLLYPATILLWIGAFILLVLFVKSLRESIVVLCGLLLPTLGYIYVKWLFGGDLTTLLTEFWMSIATTYSHPSPLWKSVAAYPTALLIITAILVFFSLLQVEVISIRYVARTRLYSTFVFVTLGCAMFLIPSFNIESLVVLAAPLSIATTPALLRLRSWISVPIFISMALLAVWYIYLMLS